jgi:hypothetical protein
VHKRTYPYTLVPSLLMADLIQASGSFCPAPWAGPKRVGLQSHACGSSTSTLLSRRKDRLPSPQGMRCPPSKGRLICNASGLGKWRGRHQCTKGQFRTSRFCPAPWPETNLWELQSRTCESSTSPLPSWQEGSHSFSSGYEVPTRQKADSIAMP